MTNISSQELRNVYEKFYSCMRNYLWPMQTLEKLANIEVEIYSAFIDVPKLLNYLDTIERDISSVLKDDKLLFNQFNKLRNIISDKDIQMYLKIGRVNETNQEKPKQLKLNTEGG